MKKRVIVVGAGLGGISAAISLATAGYEVMVFEKNEKIGGKLNFLSKKGYSFDLGPSILTLPHLFRRLFEAGGRRMEDYIPLQPVTPHWRNHFEDGSVIDLYLDRNRMHKELAKLDPRHVAEFERFMAFAEKQYDLVDKGYFEKGLDTVWDFFRFYSLKEFFSLDFMTTMHKRSRKFFSDERLVNIFDFFIKYVGSSAVNAPGFMHSLPVIQFRYDLWYVPGGMYNIARGFQKYMDELGITVHLKTEVTRINRIGADATGVTAGGQDYFSDFVVSNMEVIPAYEKLTDAPPAFMKELEKFEPACSGLILDLGLDTTYPQLAHHNFFFSGSQEDHFDSVFNKKKLPDDPTIYLVAASKTDPTVAPKGCDCLKILPHIPYINDDAPFTPEDYHAFKERVVDKLERMGLKNLRKHTVFEHVWTPQDIRANYYSNKGSIYGVVSDKKKNLAFKAPKRSRLLRNLYFTGGSVNPGGGMPMVLLSGQNVAKAIIKDDKEND